MVTYRDAGVDIDAGNALVERIQKHCPDIGGFSGLYPLGDQYLAASTDGVGTKLKLAIARNQHRGVGIDLVAMVVNDIIAVGAKPLFFLDYYGTGKLDVASAEEVILGILDGCDQAGCALLGGETAEMPGMYQGDDYDLAGFGVGIVDKDKVVDGRSVRPGDRILALASSGVHSNGFSLVRAIIARAGLSMESPIIDELLTPTRIYVRETLRLLRSHPIKAIAHITGGGLIENTERVIPAGLKLSIDFDTWQRPRIFNWLQEAGGVAEAEMIRTFNVGIGMTYIVSPEAVNAACAELPDLIEIGEVTA